MSKLSTIIAKESRITEIDFVRAFAIIGVLAVHATSFATIEMLPHQNSYPIYNFINIFMKFGTPIFIFLSSFVLFLSYFHKPINKSTLISFYRRRLVYIIIPFLVFSTIYYGAVALTREDGQLPPNLFIDYAIKLLTGTSYSHLYFVFISIQFYLLFPIILLALQKFPRFIPWCIPFGFSLQWGFYALDHFIYIPNIGSWAFSYFSFYMLGVYVGIHFKKIQHFLFSTTEHVKKKRTKITSAAIWSLWILTGLSHVIIQYKLRVHHIVYPKYVYSMIWNVYIFMSSFVFMQAAFYLQRKVSAHFLLRKLRELGQFAFGIYLLHPLLLAAYRELRPTTEHTAILHGWYAGGFVLALIGSWVIVAFTNRYFPFAWLLFGKNEHKKKDNPHISA
ncbi:acyltransferase [Paenibacillus sp. L3-i20]|uniref:acyltransferase n=1 Tax=Paenibacillus sp. L3-i20 TaxID=2905833 RepID=UPI001EDD0C9F|nr:acyltransferase [Paenibacillus sp. L3-i20]GKU78157.1 acyltransferase 3 [Paenibacillus sp. L3-i20]